MEWAGVFLNVEQGWGGGLWWPRQGGCGRGRKRRRADRKAEIGQYTNSLN